MAKHKLTRFHNGNNEGDSVELNSDQEIYFKSVGLIKEEKNTFQTKEEKQRYKNKLNGSKDKNRSNG